MASPWCLSIPVQPGACSGSATCLLGEHGSTSLLLNIKVSRFRRWAFFSSLAESAQRVWDVLTPVPHLLRPCLGFPSLPHTSDPASERPFTVTGSLVWGGWGLPSFSSLETSFLCHVLRGALKTFPSIWNGKASSNSVSVQPLGFVVTLWGLHKQL